MTANSTARFVPEKVFRPEAFNHSARGSDVLELYTENGPVKWSFLHCMGLAYRQYLVAKVVLGLGFGGEMCASFRHAEEFVVWSLGSCIDALDLPRDPQQLSGKPNQQKKAPSGTTQQVTRPKQPIHIICVCFGFLRLVEGRNRGQLRGDAGTHLGA